MYRFSINEVSETKLNEQCMFIYFTWTNNNGRKIKDMLFVYEHRWFVKFDYPVGSMSSEQADLYNHIAQLSKTSNFRMLYVK
jgi:hypothetical protein